MNATTTPNKATVLAFTPTFAPGYRGGGPVKSMIQILDTLPDWITVILLTADRDFRDGAPYPGLSGKWTPRGQHCVFYANFRKPTHWLRILRRLHGTSLDLIYLNSLWSPLYTVLPVIARRLAILPSRQLLLAPRGELSPGALGIRARKKRAFLSVWRPFLRRVDPLWHASTPMEATDIRRVFPWARTIVRINSRGDTPREEIVPSQELPQFVFIGRISEKKNLEFALEALALVSVPVQFHIYGPREDSAYWRNCQGLINALPDHIQASYRGTLRPSEVRSIFAQYDGFIFPTLGENFGHVIAESLSAGCPVICSVHTPWTAVLDNGGGAALKDFVPALWAQAIAARASQTTERRNRAKQETLRAYGAWRQTCQYQSAIEAALSGAILELDDPQSRGTT